MTDATFDFRACQQCVCSAVRKASRAITHHYDTELRSAGLRVTQFTLLATLAQTGPMPMTRLAAFLGLERTTLTRNLKPLLRDKLVEPRDEKDGRIRRIAITPRGEAAAREAFPLWKKAQDSVKKLTAAFDIRLFDAR
jgi:DNA-binding MarR family transcriptional regulator